MFILSGSRPAVQLNKQINRCARSPDLGIWQSGSLAAGIA